MDQKKKPLQFNCLECSEPVNFSLFELEKQPNFACDSCQKKYAFSDNFLKQQLRKFENLCRQLIESEDILGSTSVGVDVGEHHVKIPYKILLTRLNPSLDLKIGDKTLSIRFRLEPCKDLAHLSKELLNLQGDS